MRPAPSLLAAATALLAGPAAAERPAVLGDLNPSPFTPIAAARDFLDLGDGRSAFVTAEGLWATDGTPEGTRPLAARPSGTGSRGDDIGLARLGARLIFVAGERPLAGEPWVFEGGQSTLLAELEPGDRAASPHLRTLDDTLWLRGTGDYSAPPSLFRMRADQATPERVIDGAASALTQLEIAAAGEGATVWAAGVGQQGLRVWRVAGRGSPREADLSALPTDARAGDGRLVLLEGPGDPWLTFVGGWGPLALYALRPDGRVEPIARASLAAQAQVVLRVGHELLVSVSDEVGAATLVRLRPNDGTQEILHTFVEPGTAFLRPAGEGRALVLPPIGPEAAPALLYANRRLTPLPGLEGRALSGVAEDAGGLVVSGWMRGSREPPQFVARVTQTGLRTILEIPATRSGAPALHTSRGRVFFSAATEAGTGLFVVHGDEARWLSTLTARRTADLSPHHPHAFGDADQARLYFRGSAGFGYGLGVSDGTTRGTTLEPGGRRVLGRVADRLIVAEYGCVGGGTCLEALDPTGTRTSLGTLDGMATGGAQAGGHLYFKEGFTRLWRTDGRSAAEEVLGGRYSSGGSGLMRRLGRGVVFTNSQYGALRWTDGAEVRELPDTRGLHHFGLSFGDDLLLARGRQLDRLRADGTKVVLQPDVTFQRGGSVVHDFAVQAGGRVFATTEHGLIVTDGTPEGTLRIPVGERYTRLEAAAALGDRLFFTAEDPEAGYEPWVSDGTVAGTHRFVDLFEGPGSSDPGAYLEVDGYLLFAANTATVGRELFVSDGTPAGTRRLFDAVPGPFGADPTWFARAGDTVFFDGVHPQFGRELWAFDWTKVQDILPKTPAPPEPAPRPAPADPEGLKGNSGCSCRSAPTGDTALALIALMGLWLTRRRCV